MSQVRVLAQNQSFSTDPTGGHPEFEQISQVLQSFFTQEQRDLNDFVYVVTRSDHNKRFQMLDAGLVLLDQENPTEVQLVKADSREPLSTCTQCLPYIFLNSQLGGVDEPEGQRIYNDAPDRLLLISINPITKVFQVFPHPEPDLLNNLKYRGSISVKRIPSDDTGGKPIETLYYKTEQNDQMLPEVFSVSYTDSKGDTRGALFAILVVGNVFVYTNINTNLPEFSNFLQSIKNGKFTDSQQEKSFKQTVLNSLLEKLSKLRN